MQVENLDPDSTKALCGFIDCLKRDNPEIKTTTFPMHQFNTMKEELSDKEDLISLRERVESLERKIDEIFGGYRLIRGRWIDVKSLPNCQG